MPFSSSAIGANKKSSNSGPSGETEGECAILTTELACRYQAAWLAHNVASRRAAAASENT
jgi:hypothetical protein